MLEVGGVHRLADGFLESLVQVGVHFVGVPGRRVGSFKGANDSCCCSIGNVGGDAWVRRVDIGCTQGDGVIGSRRQDEAHVAVRSPTEGGFHRGSVVAEGDAEGV
eukprot:scaffold4418_cov140-Cylindrotheca_fusiformis.AAC.1